MGSSGVSERCLFGNDSTLTGSETGLEIEKGKMEIGGTNLSRLKPRHSKRAEEF